MNDHAELLAHLRWAHRIPDARVMPLRAHLGECARCRLEWALRSFGIPVGCRVPKLGLLTMLNYDRLWRADGPSEVVRRLVLGHSLRCAACADELGLVLRLPGPGPGAVEESVRKVAAALRAGRRSPSS